MADLTNVTPEVRDTATAALAVRSDRGSRVRRLSPRGAFLLRRLGRLMVSIAVVIVAAFLLVHLVPGDPVRAVLGPEATQEMVEATRSRLGLDKPIHQQFLDYVAGLVRGDFGISIRAQRPVSELIAQRFPPTITLGAWAFVVAVVGALPIGIAAAVSTRSGRNRIFDTGISSFLGVLIAIPNFLLAVSLIALFPVSLGILPAAGWGSFEEAILPIVTLALGPMAYMARIVQVEMIAVLDMTYMTTARSKRLPSRLIYLRHALPNIVTASLTVGGLMLSGLTAGTVLIETVFAIPGMGTTLVSAVSAKDYPVIQGAVIIYAFIVLGVNLIVDLILVSIDPRSSITEG